MQERSFSQPTISPLGYIGIGFSIAVFYTVSSGLITLTSTSCWGSSTPYTATSDALLAYALHDDLLCFHFQFLLLYSHHESHRPRMRALKDCWDRASGSGFRDDGAWVSEG